MTIKSDVLIESKSLRETVIDRIDVLEKVKRLELMSDDIHVTVEMAANYYEVNHEVIRQIAVRRKDELETDGMKTLRGKELSDIKSLCGLSPNIGKLMVFPRRAILRIGMLLQDSEIAKAIRTRLLDIEQEKQINNVVQIPTELNMLGQLVEGFNQSFKAMMQIQGEVSEAKNIANQAQKKAEATDAKNKELEEAINDVRSGLVDVDLPLRTQFNDAVRKYAKRHALEWDTAYNNIYSTLGKQNHVDLKKRLLNRQEKGEKIKMVDIVEELNLLVPAIRLAKTMSGAAV